MFCFGVFESYEDTGMEQTSRQQLPGLSSHEASCWEEKPRLQCLWVSQLDPLEGKKSLKSDDGKCSWDSRPATGRGEEQ